MFLAKPAKVAKETVKEGSVKIRHTRETAISNYQADTNYEIASLHSQRRLLRLLTNASR